MKYIALRRKRKYRASQLEEEAPSPSTEIKTEPRILEMVSLPCRENEAADFAISWSSLLPNLTTWENFRNIKEIYQI